MALTILGDMAAGFSAGVGSSLLQYQAQKALNRQAQKDYKENLKLSHQLNLKGQFDAIKQSTSAMKAAGLSPVLAAGGNFSAPAASAPLAQSSAGMPDVAGNIAAVRDLDLLDTQKKLMRSQAHKNESEAIQTDLRNQHTQSQDRVLTESTYQILDEMRNNTDNPFMRGFIDNYLDQNADKIDLGAYEAFNKIWFDFSQKERDRELDFIQKEFDKKVLQLQYENNAAAALADMSRAKRFEIYAAVNQMNANIARLNAETSLTEDQRDKLRAETSKLGQEVLSIFHSDPIAMYKAGDISALLVGLGYDAVKAGAAGAGFAIGAGVTRGAGVAKSGVSSAKNVSSSRPPRTYKEIERYPNGKIKRSVHSSE